MPLLRLEGVTKVFAEGETATTALQGITCTIEAGEFVSVIGQSGSGKSTLLHILGFLDRPTNGAYYFRDEDTTTFSDERLAHIRNQEIGFVFQAFHLLARATVLDNVLLPLAYSTTPNRERRQKALAALEKVQLTHRLQHTPAQLSGGEKQRVAIARALVNDPAIVFADEPTGNLDSKTGEIVMDSVDKLHAQGKTVILITHETSTASYANRMIELRDGEIVADRTVSERVQHYHK